MKECRFCKDPVQESKVFRLVAPNGYETFFCEECSNDILNHILKGEAERERLAELTELVKDKKQNGGFQYNGFNKIESLWPSDIEDMGKSKWWSKYAVA